MFKNKKNFWRYSLHFEWKCTWVHSFKNGSLLVESVFQSCKRQRQHFLGNLQKAVTAVLWEPQMAWTSMFGEHEDNRFWKRCQRRNIRFVRASVESSDSRFGKISEVGSEFFRLGEKKAIVVLCKHYTVVNDFNLLSNEKSRKFYSDFDEIAVVIKQEIFSCSEKFSRETHLIERCKIMTGGYLQNSFLFFEHVHRCIWNKSNNKKTYQYTNFGLRRNTSNFSTEPKERT